jgi:hypothetical protein
METPTSVCALMTSLGIPQPGIVPFEVPHGESAWGIPSRIIYRLFAKGILVNSPELLHISKFSSNKHTRRKRTYLTLSRSVA